MKKYYGLTLSCSALFFLALYCYFTLILHEDTGGLLLVGLTNSLVGLTPMTFSRTNKSKKR
jgi:hypothetical protein